MTKEERDAIRAWQEEDLPWVKDIPKDGAVTGDILITTLLKADKYIAKSIKYIAALLDALDEAERLYESANTQARVFARAADREKARAEALERAIRLHSYEFVKEGAACWSCKREPCVEGCKGQMDEWQFDEARFKGGDAE